MKRVLESEGESAGSSRIVLRYLHHGSSVSYLKVTMTTESAGTVILG